MEILILFVGVCVPLMAIGFYSLYKTNQEERKEQLQVKSA